MKLETIYHNGTFAGFNIVSETPEEWAALESIHWHVKNAVLGEKLVLHHTGDVDETTMKFEFIKRRFVVKNIVLHQNYRRNMKVIPAPDNSVKYRCTLCHSQEIKVQAWVQPNRHNKFDSYCSDDKGKTQCYCNRCELFLPAEPVPPEIKSQT